MSLKQNLKDLPMNSVRAAVTDPFLRIFWCFYIFLVLVFWLTH